MNESSGIFITGGSRGLGRALAGEFARRGHRVFISGRSKEIAENAARQINDEIGKALVGSGFGDVGSYADLDRLKKEAILYLGRIDHWVNNAGINQEPGKIWEVPVDDMEKVVRTDFLGALFGARCGFEATEAYGGWVWFVEGHGSDGRIMSGLSVYGSAKRGVAYLWRAMAKEAAGTKVKIGALSPGIMVTDFIMQNKKKQDPESWERSVSAFNILADKPQTVAAFLVPKMLAARKSGVRLAWLTLGKILRRFLFSGFRKRNVMD